MEKMLNRSFKKIKMIYLANTL